jgi:nitrite reductase/ring-hydroxylating ferredoxin subunit
MMSLAWTDFPDAPALGASLCQAADLPETGVLSLQLDGYPVLLLRLGGTLRAYVNACPHQFLPLDHHGDNLLSADGKHLLCTNHAAVFRADDGIGIEGEGLNCALSPIPVVVVAGQIVIGD